MSRVSLRVVIRGSSRTVAGILRAPFPPPLRPLPFLFGWGIDFLKKPYD